MKRLAVGPGVDSPGVEDAQAGQVLALGRPVVAPQELIAAADGQHHHPARDGPPQRLALGRQQVGGHPPLLSVLRPADEDQVVGRRVQRLAYLQFIHRQLDAPRRAAAAQAEDVPPIAVEVHLLGVEVGQTQAKLHGSGLLPELRAMPPAGQDAPHLQHGRVRGDDVQRTACRRQR